VFCITWRLSEDTVCMINVKAQKGNVELTFLSLNRSFQGSLAGQHFFFFFFFFLDLNDEFSHCNNKRSCVRVIQHLCRFKLKRCCLRRMNCFFLTAKLLNGRPPLLSVVFRQKCGAKQEFIFPTHVLNLNKLSTENKSLSDGLEAAHKTTHTHT